MMRVRGFGRAFLLCFLPFVCAFARAATMAEVDQLVEKANGSLRDFTANRAKSLNDAIASCQEALALVEEVAGVSEEERQKKATEIMSVIFWCRKMMPLDLSGRAVSTASSTRGGGPTSETQPGGAPAQPPASPAGKELDEIAFNRAKSYASQNPQDLEGTLLRYEGVAASYPRSKWGGRAAKEAEKVRARVEKLRASAATTFRARLEKLDFAGASSALDKAISKETSRAKRTQLEGAKDDVEALRLLWGRVVMALERRTFPLGVPFGEVGLEKKAWVKGGSGKGVSVSIGEKDAPATVMPWDEFGARPAVLLAEKLLNLHDGETLRQLAVAATVAGDYIGAQRLFERLIRTDPRRISSVAAYFERALSGYSSTAEGGAKTRFKGAKDLVRKKRLKEAMATLSALQKELSKDSTLQGLLKEVDKYRRQVRKRYAVDDGGEPITAFERKVRKVFGGDARLDEGTGRIEVLYDFSEGAQLKDWMIVDSHMKPSGRGGWIIHSGVCRATGKYTLFMWKFVLQEFDVRADVTYEDTTGRLRAIIHTCMTKRYPYGVWAWCRRGEARLNEGRLSRSGWFSRARFIWRPGEVATLRFSQESGSPETFVLTVNGQYAVSGRERHRPGCVAFSFEGGRGSVDNVCIRGKLDMRWFMDATKGIR